MTIIDEIRAEFQKRFEMCQSVSEDDRNALDVQDYYRGKYTAYSEAISFINILLQEQEKEQHSEDLEEAAKHYSEHTSFHWPNQVKPSYDAFKAGAEWQYQKDKTLIKKAHDCGFGAGSVWQKAKMMENAVEGEVCGRVIDHINIRFPDGLCKYLEPKNISHIPADVTKYNVGDKVRVIIVKEEEK